MSKNSKLIIFAVILLQIVNVFFYLQLRNFKDFENAGFSKKMINLEGIDTQKIFSWQANTYIPFAILNLSEWMPYHQKGSIVSEGMTMYSIPFQMVGKDVRLEDGGFKFPTKFIGGSSFDLEAVDKHANNIPELKDQADYETSQLIFAKNFLDVRGYALEMVVKGRAWLIALGNILIILSGLILFVCLKAINYLSNARISKLHQAWDHYHQLKKMLSQIHPDYNKWWCIADREKILLTPQEKELHTLVYRAIGLVVKEYVDASILGYYLLAKDISSAELSNQMTEFCHSAQARVSAKCSGEQKNQEKKVALLSARDEYNKMSEHFKYCVILKDSREYGRQYLEVYRTLNAISDELLRDKVHEKRFAYVRKALKELYEAVMPA